MSSKRTLGVVRLSVETDETTSPARQREILTASAVTRDARIIGWAEDLDVSASKVPPKDRPRLAKWLARPGEFDEIMFWRIDRFVRSPADLTDMIRWCKANGKGLVSATESFDLNDSLGEAMAYLASIFAKMESKATSERVTGAHEYLRRNMRWGGGRPPYGYKVTDNPDGPGKVLAVNGETAETVREAVKRVISGESVNAVATDFNARGILPPFGREKRKGRESPPIWQDTSLRLILRDKALIGHVVHDGVSVLGEDGMPLVCAEPLISEEDWGKLQAQLSTTAMPNKRRNDPAMLRDVAQCGLCGAPLYQWVKHQKGRAFTYYRCRYAYTWKAGQAKTCGAPLINAAKLDAAVDEAILSYGSVPIVETKVTPGDSQAANIAAVGKQIAELTTERYVRRIIRDDFDQVMAQLQAEHARLSALPAKPDVIEDIPTDKTVADVWPILDVKGKRQFLVCQGWKISAQRRDGGKLVVVIVDEHGNELITMIPGEAMFKTPLAFVRAFPALQRLGT